MNRKLIAEKLDSLGRCLERLSSKRPSTLEELENDIDLQDIVAINMERAVQLCVDIASVIIADSQIRPPQTMSESFKVLAETNLISSELCDQLVKAVGFRNLAVHAYDKIDWKIVFELLGNNLSDLREFGRAISKLL